MEKATSNENLKQEDIFKDYKSLAQAIWNTIVTVHDDLQISQATLAISDLEFVLSYPSNGKVEFISFPFRALDKTKVLRLINNLAEKSEINGKIFQQKTVMEFMFHYN